MTFCADGSIDAMIWSCEKFHEVNDDGGRLNSMIFGQFLCDPS